MARRAPGKTTLAHIVAAELGVRLHVTSGPALEKKGDLAGILTNLEAHDVLFIDEVHRLSAVVEENLYPAMEDLRFDVVVGDGVYARSVPIELQPFTLVGATTRAGLLTSPMRDRFGIVEHLEFYTRDELAQIIKRSASLMDIELEGQSETLIATRSRGTPRIANRLLRRIRDIAEVKANGIVTPEVAELALIQLDVDSAGFDRMDRRLLLSIIDKFDGGRLASIHSLQRLEKKNRLLRMYTNPSYSRRATSRRTHRGRIATRTAYVHFNRPWGGRQESLV